VAYVGGVVFVAWGLRASAGSVLLVLAAGARLSAYIGATVGELGFLRGFWMDGSRRLAWLEDYAEAVAASTDTAVPAAIARDITFEHVSFAYPGTSRLVLDDVSLRLPAGAIVAIVGENGAGKTTLVKLLSRMYDPTSGSIRVDGTPLSRMPAHEWRARLAGAFQDFVRFEFTAQQSVGLGDEPRMELQPVVAAAVGRGDGRRGQTAGRPGHAAGPDLAGRGRCVVWPVAEAGPCPWVHAGTAAAAGPGRADGGPGCRNRTCAVPALCGGGS
jgi:ATP-binding cassette subfamily B protein